MELSIIPPFTGLDKLNPLAFEMLKYCKDPHRMNVIFAKHDHSKINSAFEFLLKKTEATGAQTTNQQGGIGPMIDSKGDLTGDDYEDSMKPVFASDTAPKKFQESLRKYLSRYEPQQMLDILNEYQRKTPFVLTDPKMPLVNGPFTKYGYRDLIQFFSIPHMKPAFGVVRNKMTHMNEDGTAVNDNPFYNPISYSLTTEEESKYIENIKEKYNFKKRLDEIRNLYDLSNMNYLKNPSKLLNYRNKNYLTVLNEIIELNYLVHNPVLRSKFASTLHPDDARPMASYYRKNFENIYKDLYAYHPIAKKTPEHGMFEIDVPKVSHLQTATPVKKARKKATKKSHKKR